MFWLTMSLITFLWICASVRKHGGYPIGDWDFSDWIKMLFLTIVWPLGMVVCVAAWLEAEHPDWFKKIGEWSDKVWQLISKELKP